MATVMTTAFQLAGADGGPLRGEVKTAERGADRPAVVICHGFKGFMDWGFFPKLADRLARAGITAVSFNFTGSGIGPDRENFTEEERFGHATFSKDLKDVRLVCDGVLNGTIAEGVMAPTKLGLFGHSRGGGTSVLYAADHDAIAALVTWAAIGSVQRWPDATVATWRKEGKIDVANARTGQILPLYTDILDDIDAHAVGKLDVVVAAARIRAPWLIMHGDADETVPSSDAEALAKATNDTATLQIVEGGSHTMGGRHPWAGATPELELAMGETVGWFVRTLF
ncbi:MAG: alpha/beta fold hydrolase [Gemmatimonadetes bacterium]|nr:alpha/beta fold hydrolase [Gemmatimonadota bacterium]